MTLPAKRTRQELFDIAYRGLAGQGWMKSVDGDDDCMYRGDDGLKCAIGYCIDDDNYHLDMEGNGAYDAEVRKAAGVYAKDEDFVDAMQYCHDTSSGDMQELLDALAHKYNLTIPKVD